MAMEIQCSGCGKRIPFAGEVCPYCQRDKSDDQMKETELQLSSFTAAIVAVIAGVIVYQFSTLKAALITGAVLGVIVLVVMNWAINMTKPKT